MSFSQLLGKFFSTNSRAMNWCPVLFKGSGISFKMLIFPCFYWLQHIFLIIHCSIFKFLSKKIGGVLPEEWIPAQTINETGWLDLDSLKLFFVPLRSSTLSDDYDHLQLFSSLKRTWRCLLFAIKRFITLHCLSRVAFILSLRK